MIITIPTLTLHQREPGGSIYVNHIKNGEQSGIETITPEDMVKMLEWYWEQK